MEGSSDVNISMEFAATLEGKMTKTLFQTFYFIR